MGSLEPTPKGRLRHCSGATKYFGVVAALMSDAHGRSMNATLFDSNQDDAS